MTDPARVDALADELEARGLDVADLRLVADELAVVQQPPGRLGRLLARLKGKLKQQWGHVRGELKETGEGLSILRARLDRKEKLTPEEREAVRAQVADLVRILPAGLFAAANAVLPIPGTSLLTPKLLQKMGLLPSRWREAHMLKTLQDQADSLRAGGLEAEAGEVEQLAGEIEAEADAREEVERNATLLAVWDKNENARWDDDEKTAYRAELLRTIGLADTRGVERRWYLRLEGRVMGPIALRSLLDAPDGLDPNLLVCFGDRTAWVDFLDVARRKSHI